MKALFRLFTLLVALHVASPALLATEATNPCTGTPTSFTVAPILTASVQVSGSGCVSFSGSSTAIDGYTEDTDACGKVTRTVNPVGNVSSYYVIVGPDGKTYNSSSVTPNIPGGYTCTYVVYSDKGLSATASASRSVSSPKYVAYNWTPPTLRIQAGPTTGGEYPGCTINFGLESLEEVAGSATYEDVYGCFPSFVVPVKFDSVDVRWYVSGPIGFVAESGTGQRGSVKPAIGETFFGIGTYSPRVYINTTYTLPVTPYSSVGEKRTESQIVNLEEKRVVSDKVSYSINLEMGTFAKWKEIAKKFKTPGNASSQVGSLEFSGSYDKESKCCDVDPKPEYTYNIYKLAVVLGQIDLPAVPLWGPFHFDLTISGKAGVAPTQIKSGCGAAKICLGANLEVEVTAAIGLGSDKYVLLQAGLYGSLSGSYGICWDTETHNSSGDPSVSGELGWFLKAKGHFGVSFDRKGVLVSGNVL